MKSKNGWRNPRATCGAEMQIILKTGLRETLEHLAVITNNCAYGICCEIIPFIYVSCRMGDMCIVILNHYTHH